MKVTNLLQRKNSILLRELVVTDFKLRYQGICGQSSNRYFCLLFCILCLINSSALVSKSSTILSIC